MGTTNVSINYTMMTKDNVQAYSGPDKYSYNKTSLLPNQATVTATIKCNEYYYVQLHKKGVGWVESANLTLITDNSSASIIQEASNIVSSDSDNMVSVYNSYVTAGLSDASDGSFLTQNMNNVLGIPYQFPNHVDRKLTDSVFGRKYAERIITNMPLLLLTPGKVDFMSNVNQSAKTRITEALFNGAFNIDDGFGDSDLQNYINNPAKYYTFSFDPEYYLYVNSILNSVATLMGIGDVEINIGGKIGPLASFDWSNAKNPLTASVGQPAINYICLYIDGINTKNESFSNDTMESQLASKINSFSDTAKEIQFLLGDAATSITNAVSNDTMSQAQETIDEIVNSTLAGNSIFKDLGSQFSTVASGGKLLFPQIYQDSSFSQSYDISMKLRCPHPTPLNWYLDIMVPLGYLYALTLPRAADSGYGYKSPFLIRGFYKSIFNIDMGIITDMSVSKGKEGAWTNDGYPTEVDIDITIKDLYNVLFMSKYTTTGFSGTISEVGKFVSNDQFMSFLANQVGINIMKTDMERTIELYGMIAKNAITQKPNYWKNSIEGAFNNKLLSIYQGLTRSL